MTGTAVFIGMTMGLAGRSHSMERPRKAPAATRRL